MGSVTYTAYGTFTQVVTDQEPANNGLVVSSEIDNTSNHFMYMDIELSATFGTNPVAGGYFAIYCILALDGTNYADGADGSVVPPSTSWICNIPLRAVTTAQKVSIPRLLMPNSKFKLVVENKSGQTVSTNTLQLYYRGYTETVA